MNDLERARLTRRHRELMERAQKAVEEARRNRSTAKRSSIKARGRAADLAEWAKAAAAHAQEERIRSEEVWNRTAEAIAASQAISSRSSRR